MFLVIHLSPPRWKVGAFLIAQLIKNPPAVYLGSTPGLGRFPGKEKGYPLQYSGLENSMDCIVDYCLEKTSVYKSWRPLI